MLLAAGDADDRQLAAGAVLISRLAEAGRWRVWLVRGQKSEKVLLSPTDKLPALQAPFLHPLLCVGILNFKSCGPGVDTAFSPHLCVCSGGKGFWRAFEGEHRIGCGSDEVSAHPGGCSALSPLQRESGQEFVAFMRVIVEIRTLVFVRIIRQRIRYWRKLQAGVIFVYRRQWLQVCH